MQTVNQIIFVTFADDESSAQRREIALHPHALFRCLGQVQIAFMVQERSLIEVQLVTSGKET